MECDELIDMDIFFLFSQFFLQNFCLCNNYCCFKLKLSTFKLLVDKKHVKYKNAFLTILILIYIYMCYVICLDISHLQSKFWCCITNCR